MELLCQFSVSLFKFSPSFSFFLCRWLIFSSFSIIWKMLPKSTKSLQNSRIQFEASLLGICSKFKVSLKCWKDGWLCVTPAPNEWACDVGCSSAIKINVWWYYAFNVMFFSVRILFVFSSPKKHKRKCLFFILLFLLRYALEGKKDITEAYAYHLCHHFFFTRRRSQFLLCICYYYYFVYHLYKIHETSVRIKSNPWDVLLLLMLLLLPLLMTTMPMPQHCLFSSFCFQFLLLAFE